MRPAEELVEHFFRHESANLVAVLTRAFGWRRVDLIEDMVSAAIVEAMQTWRHKGVPDRPAAWIHRVARNRVIDALRREKLHDQAMAFSGQTAAQSEQLVVDWLDEDQLGDSLLRMMFVCCHPALDRTSQVAMTLKILCGFSVGEIARGLLLPAETVKKRVQRAKKKLAELHVQVELPDASDLRGRIDAVHEVLYLMFNEGYSTSHSVEPIRDDVCEEAARLCHLLCQQTEFCFPESRALLALMLFHAARLDARVDQTGQVVLLEDQDRSTWDHRLIEMAKRWMTRSAEPSALGTNHSRYHFEAAIAMHHCLAASVQETDWHAIIALYDQLSILSDSPIYVLNRAIAKCEAGQHQAALDDLMAIRSDPKFRHYPLFDCAMARVHQCLGNGDLAVRHLKGALEKQPAEHEAAQIRRRLKQLQGDTL